MRNVSLGIQALCRWFTFLLIIPVVVASQARAQNQDLTFSLRGIPDQTALYQQSAQLSNGRNTSSKFPNRGAFDFGGGLDYRLFRFLGLRGERFAISSRAVQIKRRAVLKHPGQLRAKWRYRCEFLTPFFM